MWTDRVVAVATVLILVATSWAIWGFASGRYVRKEIFHASNSTDCLIVHNGARVSVDCWVVEGEHNHELASE